MQPTAEDLWIAYRKPRPQARLRLLCFPYAGGGALTYRPWAVEMPPESDVLPVQLPGRERRLRERPHTRVGPLVEAATRSLEPYLDRPFAVFGYSMGALIGYEFVQRLRRERGLEPVHVLVAARRAPQLPPDPDDYYKLSDPDFKERLREMNGTPAEVLEHPELMELVLPLLRADFELNDTYEPAGHPPLGCPLTVFGGLEDGEVTREELEAWRAVTTGPFQLRMFAGDHFFLNQHQSAFRCAVAEDLLRHSL